MNHGSTIKLSTQRLKLATTILAVLYVGFLMLPVALVPIAEETHRAAEESPFFGLAGVDLERFSREVENLEKSTEPLAEVYSSPEDKYSIRALHPIAFLKELQALEQSRRTLSQKPSLAHALVYRSNLKRTVRRYEESIARYRDALLRLNREENETYHFLDSATSINTLIEAANLLLENARALNQEIRAGTAAFVPSAAEWRASLNKRPFSETDKEDLAFVRRFVEANGDWEIAGPALEVPTDCFGAVGEPDFFYIVKLRNETVPMYFKPAFFHYPEARFADSRYYKPLRDAGFDYYWQPEFNHYMCPDLTYQVEVMTLYKIRTLLEQWKPRGESPVDYSSSEVEKLPLEESIKRFLSEDPLRRRTQLELFRSVRSILSRYDEDELETLLGAERARVLSEIRLLELQKTGFLEEVVARGARLAKNLPELMRRIQEPLEAKELLIMRSYPSLYFLPFNDSVWRAGRKPGFIDSVERSRYYYSREELDHPRSEEELIELMRISAHLIKR